MALREVFGVGASVALIALGPAIWFTARRTGARSAAVYRLVYAAGALASLAMSAYRYPDEPLWVGLAMGLVGTGPLGCFIWRDHWKRATRRGAAGAGQGSRRELRPMPFWFWVVGSTAPFLAGGVIVTLLFGAAEPGVLRQGFLLTAVVGAFNAIGWVLLRLLAPDAVRRMGLGR